MASIDLTHANTRAQPMLKAAARGPARVSFSLITLTGLGLACLLAPWLAPYDYRLQDLALGATPPSASHWFGTDALGRDLLSRVLHGGRISFAVGILATWVSLCIGVTYGAIAGYWGGRLDRFMMRVVDALYAFPFTLLVIVLVVVFGRAFWLIFIAIGAVEWLTMARIVRGEVRQLKARAFVRAAEALGQSPWGVIRRHLAPNFWGIVMVYAALTVPNVMLLEAFMSFLGLGVQPPMTSWGDLIHQGSGVMETYPWVLLFPSLFFAVTLLALNFLGDSLKKRNRYRVRVSRS